MVLFQLVFSILPTLLEVGLSCRLLALRFGPRYVCATLAMLVGYVGFTVKVANARWNDCKSEYEISFNNNADRKARSRSVVFGCVGEMG